MYMRYLLLFGMIAVFNACQPLPKEALSVHDYFNYGDTSVGAGGVRMIPIETPVGKFRVWTKRIGNNPRIKVLLLHGGPASTHEYMECFESFFPKEGFE